MWGGDDDGVGPVRQAFPQGWARRDAKFARDLRRSVNCRINDRDQREPCGVGRVAAPDRAAAYNENPFHAPPYGIIAAATDVENRYY